MEVVSHVLQMGIGWLFLSKQSLICSILDTIEQPNAATHFLGLVPSCLLSCDTSTALPQPPYLTSLNSTALSQQPYLNMSPEDVVCSKEQFPACPDLPIPILKLKLLWHTKDFTVALVAQQSRADLQGPGRRSRSVE
ncbi:hypothetical protein ABVK25_000300 [Lepraria finkii]|uniref:Uncharacterized protein n=1 Tax=Lepraria finkii TaxID=1340010 RepID=A0ABR4BMH4_9LECA